MGLPGLLCREMPRKVGEEPGRLPSHCNQLLSALEAGELQTAPPQPPAPEWFRKSQALAELCVWLSLPLLLMPVRGVRV